MLIINDVTLTFVIFSELHHFTSWIDSIVCFVIYNFVLWKSILTYVFVWVFVMYIFVRMTFHIIMGFRHVHVCTNDYPFPCVWVFFMHIFYEWLSISFEWVFVMYMLYEWLIHNFEWNVVFYISVRMTIFSFWGFWHS